MKRKELELYPRMKKKKNFKICKICGLANDGLGILKADLQQILEDGMEDELLHICKDCKKGLRSGVTVVCAGFNPQKQGPCASVYTFDVDIFKKYIPTAKRGDSIEAKECPKCSIAKKFTF